MNNIIKFSVITLMVGILSSCSSTMLTSSWTKEGYTSQTYKKILVVAVSAQTSSRAAVESAMVNELKKQGINAVSSLNVFPNAKPGDKIEKDVIVSALKEKNIDGLLLLSVLDVKSEQVYVQGQTYQEPVGTVYHPSGYANRYSPYYNNYYGYYNTVYQTVHEPGYYEEQTTYYLESNFYRVSDESLVWSGQSESVDPANIGKGAKDWAYEVVSGMKTDKIFTP